MSILDQYTFSRSLSVLSSSSLVSLLSCSLCSQPLSTTTTLSSGRCPHAICQDCLSSHPGGTCPVDGCSIPAHTKDYKENRTLGQLARCLGNIKSLLEKKEIVDHNNGEDDLAEQEKKVNKSKAVEKIESSAKEIALLKPAGKNKPVDDKKAATSKASHKKAATAKLKDKKAVTAITKPEVGNDTNANEESKESTPAKAVDMAKGVTGKPGVNKVVTEKVENKNSRTVNEENKVTKAKPEDKKNVGDKSDHKIKNTEKPDEKKMATEKPVDKKATTAKPTTKRPPQSRLSLPEGKKNNKGRVRAATSSGQTMNTINTSLNQSGVSSLEKKNKKGETLLHAACSKGDLTSVQSLLSQAATPNTQDNAGWTPLHEAATTGRLDLAKLLLEAGARPSVPSMDERVTALHDAVGSGQVEMVKLLVAKGADKDARDSKGRTPRDMALSLDAVMMEVIENTVVEVQEKDIMETLLQPREMVLCLSKKVAVNAKLVKMLVETSVKMGCKRPSTQLAEDMTHLLVENGEDEDSLHFLTALVVGAEIVSTSWMLESGKQGKVISCTEFRCEGKGEEGAIKARVRRASKQPGLLAGLHFYLTGVFEPPCLTKVEVQHIVRLAGGKLITREPDPEFIPSQEATVPHHALTSSSMASTSHVILYMAGGKKEPQLKYNMQHVKTLPISWLVACITRGSVLEPGAV